MIESILSFLALLIFWRILAYYLVNKNPVLNDPQEHSAWVNGRKFSFLYLLKSADKGFIDLVFSVGKNDIAIDKILIGSTASRVSYQWYAGGSIDRDITPAVVEIPLNMTVKSSSDVKLILSLHTVLSKWTAITGEINIFGIPTSTVKTSLIKEEILTRKLALPKNTDHMLRIYNYNPNDNKPDLKVLIDFEVM